MIEQLQTALFEAATSTFEAMAFMILEPFGQEPLNAKPLVASTSVSFRGPFTGRVEVWASRDLLRMLTANMLGTDEIPPLLQQFDALGEITNIICGNILPKVAGTSEIFYLGCPKIGADHQQEGAAAKLKLGM